MEVGALELVEVLRDVECGRILAKVLRVSLVMFYNVAGEGFRIRFWYDLWCGQIPLKDLYPDIFSRAMGKEASIFELITISSMVVVGVGIFNSTRLLMSGRWRECFLFMSMFIPNA